jgi:uncharacterized membrane protein (UPF0127 family)
MRYALIANLTRTDTKIKTKVCDNFWSKFIGLMGHPPLLADEGLLFIEKSASRINTSIHMMFMSFDIAVIWLDESLQVVDKVIARKWRPYYASKAPAKYTLELHTSKIDCFLIGDSIRIDYV